jgi:hypothetical protein
MTFGTASRAFWISGTVMVVFLDKYSISVQNSHKNEERR